LFNPAFLGLLLILFFMGRLFGKLTKNIRLWKLLLLGYFALFIYAPVRDAGPILGGIFIAGMLSNHVGRFVSALSWAGNLGDALFAFRYRSAYEDIRRREREIEERERRLREAEQRQAYQQQEHGHHARTGWQQEAKGFRQKAGQQKSGTSSGARQQDAAGGKSRDQQRQTHSYSTPPQNDTRNKHLKTLGLKPGRNYSPDEIKRAYHRKAMKVHPDAGGSQAELIEVISAWEWLRA
ncbi:MAG: hypothetical protein ACK5NN_01475, partial [Sphingomonadaceae bacterium]